MSGGHRLLLMLVGVSLLTSGQAVCPDGWEESRGTCYLFVSQSRNQVGAQAACINQGGNLTSVSDEEENKFIYNLSLARCAEAACPSVWFGLIKMGDLDTDPKDEGWTWLDGSTYNNGNYNKWKDNEPTGGVACARMYVKDQSGVAGEWGDRNCDVSFPYVCKRRATAAPSTTTKTTTTTTSRPTTRTISTPITTTTTTTPDWVSWRGSLYLFLVEETYSQEDAVSVCMSYGGRLASVLSPEENEFIYNTTKASCTDSCNDVWIGLKRHGPFLVQNITLRRANWTWLDGQIYNSSWANWKSEEPTGDSACARMILNQEQHLENWADISCDGQYPCVCKKEAVETTTSEQRSTTDPTDNNSLLYIGAGVGVGVVVGIIVVIIVVVIVVKRRKKSERRDVTNSQPAPSGGAGDAGGEDGYSYVEVRPAKIMKEVMAGEGVYSEANNDAAYQDVDTASEAYVTSPPPTVGRPSVTSPSQGDEYANVKKKLQKSVTETAPKPSDAPEDSKSGVYDNDPSSPTTHKVADSGDEYALVTRSDTGEMTMAPPGGQ